MLRAENVPELLTGHGHPDIHLGKANQNSSIKCFNRTHREEIRGRHFFVRLSDVRDAAWWWMLENNQRRPHDFPDRMAPIEFRRLTAESAAFGLSA